MHPTRRTIAARHSPEVVSCNACISPWGGAEFCAKRHSGHVPAISAVMYAGFQQPPSGGRSMRKLVLAAAVALPAIGALPVAAEGFGPVHVAVNHHEHRGRCPVETVFTASINFTMPHPRGFTFSYHWERSDGAKGPTHVVRPGPGERTLVVRDRWRMGG